MAEHPYLDDLPAYALGALGPEERRVLEAHLATGCGLCEEELAVFQAAVARIPFALADRPAPAHLKKQLFDRLASETVPLPARQPALRSVAAPAPSRPSRLLPLALAASLILATSSTLLWLQARDRLSERDQALAQARQESDSLRTDLAKQAKAVAWLRDPRIQVALLSGLSATANVKAKLLFHESSDEALLYLDGLPPLPVEQSYQLWAFTGSEPLPAGVFDCRTGGPAVITMGSARSFPPNARKFAVSIEPKGGVPKPTGAIVLVGDVL